MTPPTRSQRCAVTNPTPKPRPTPDPRWRQWWDVLHGAALIIFGYTPEQAVRIVSDRRYTREAKK